MNDDDGVDLTLLEARALKFDPVAVGAVVATLQSYRAAVASLRRGVDEEAWAVSPSDLMRLLSSCASADEAASRMQQLVAVRDAAR